MPNAFDGENGKRMPFFPSWKSGVRNRVPGYKGFCALWAWKNVQIRWSELHHFYARQQKLL